MFTVSVCLGKQGNLGKPEQWIRGVCCSKKLTDLGGKPLKFYQISITKDGSRWQLKFGDCWLVSQTLGPNFSFVWLSYYRGTDAVAWESIKVGYSDKSRELLLALQGNLIATVRQYKWQEGTFFRFPHPSKTSVTPVPQLLWYPCIINPIIWGKI